MGDVRYWLGFQKVSGIGPARLRKLLGAFGELESAWRAPADALRQAGLDWRAIDNLLDARAHLDLDAELERTRREGIEILTWEDPTYPRLLRTLDDAPPVLFLRGAFTEMDEWTLAVVGTRHASPYGLEVTRRLVGELASAGLTIVSGMAMGIDGEAHRTALEAGGRTIGVLASGLDIIYPPEHRHLAEQIVAHGALVSEYPLGTQPERRNFPPRNRIISGLSRGVLVVEAGPKSGALITARYAAEQGRDVFAVPGNILTRRHAGTNTLIRSGAVPVLESRDILEELQVEMLPEKREARQTLGGLTEAENALLACLDAEPRHIDDICIQVGLSVDVVSSTLTMMELKGLVRQVGGMRYINLREEAPPYA